MTESNWIGKNWKLIAACLIAAGVAGGTAYYFTTKSAPPEIPATDEASKAKKHKKKKKRKSSESTETVLDGTVDAATKTDSKEKALELKTLGNQLYTEKKFEEAIEKYSEAIKLSPNSVFYCNRAACYANLNQHEKALEDCNEAIKLEPKYVKAFHRRALAYEKLDMPRKALNEYTIVCALENFKNQNSMHAPDRILKSIAQQRASALMVDRIHTMPSETFITAYMDSFRALPTPIQILESEITDKASNSELMNTFKLALDRKWQESLDSVESAIKTNEFSSDIIKSLALNYRGTLYFLMGKVADAVEDLDNAIVLDPLNVNSIIKRATLYMEQGEVDKTISEFEKAFQITATNPDLYYHRGQVRFLTGDYQGAVDDYNKSIEVERPNESSVYVHIQLGVARYKLGDVVGAEKKFRETKLLFPNSAEVWNYHGEILLDKKSHNEAERSFDKGIEMNPLSPLPYINKAILAIQWKQDAATAENLCRKAIEIDPLCDIAYSQLAQLLCLSNRLDEAIQVYDKAIAIARSEAEVMNVVSCQEAALAQMHVLKVNSNNQTFPEIMAGLQD